MVANVFDAAPTRNAVPGVSLSLPVLLSTIPFILQKTLHIRWVSSSFRTRWKDGHGLD